MEDAEDHRSRFLFSPPGNSHVAYPKSQTETSGPEECPDDDAPAMRLKNQDLLPVLATL